MGRLDIEVFEDVLHGERGVEAREVQDGACTTIACSNLGLGEFRQEMAANERRLLHKGPATSGPKLLRQKNLDV